MEEANFAPRFTAQADCITLVIAEVAVYYG